MAIFKKLEDNFLKGHKVFIPSVSIDCVIFGFHNNQLKVLLLKTLYAKEWALPGGFITKEEHIDDSAKRILNERTGLEDIFLQQFYTFGNPRRSDQVYTKQMIKGLQLSVPADNWLLQRFVSIGYYALVDFEAVKATKDFFSESCEWHDIHDLPSMIMDHGEIVDVALATLRTHLNYHPVGYNLLQDKFTMPELQKLYETVLDQKLDRRNFQRKMISYGILKKLKERRKGVAHKSPFLYTFDLKKYHKALKDGFQSAW